MIRTRTTAVLAAAAMVLGGCGGGDSGAGSDDATKTLVVGVDLPMQGNKKSNSEAVLNMIKLYLEQRGGKVGNFKVELKEYDDSTAAKGGWDEGTCKKNAAEHVATTDEVAVIGPQNSGCAQAMLPILNADASGPIVLVSHANTYPGLTKPWGDGEPEKYFPSGKRSFARVITTDDYQGTAAAQFAAKDLGVKKCLVLNDGQTYGRGVAKAFVDEAKKQGIELTAEQAWDSKQPTYTALFTPAKAAGVDCVYVGGTLTNNGIQLVKDKVATLGDNDAVKLIAPDGFTGSTDLQMLPQAAGMYMSFAGLATAQLRTSGGAGVKLLDAYKAKYGEDPVSNYAIYGAAALQSVMAAIEKSDGTRKGVRDAFFEGAGVNVAAGDSVIGKDTAIDPKTGDVNARDISILRMTDGKEEFLKAWPVS